MPGKGVDIRGAGVISSRPSAEDCRREEDGREQASGGIAEGGWEVKSGRDDTCVGLGREPRRQAACDTADGCEEARGQAFREERVSEKRQHEENRHEEG